MSISNLYHKDKNTPVIALLGQPNSGKSTIFNMITGSHQHVGNWPGKTVDQKEGEFKWKGACICWQILLEPTFLLF